MVFPQKFTTAKPSCPNYPLCMYTWYWRLDDNIAHYDLFHVNLTITILHIAILSFYLFYLCPWYGLKLIFKHMSPLDNHPNDFGGSDRHVRNYPFIITEFWSIHMVTKPKDTIYLLSLTNYSLCEYLEGREVLKFWFSFLKFCIIFYHDVITSSPWPIWF